MQNRSYFLALRDLYEKGKVLRFYDFIKKGVVGFSYGVSFPLTMVILDYWLKDYGVSNSVIGMFSLFHLPFALKLFFAPIIDECDIPFLSKLLGRKRSWVIFSQSMLTICVLCMAHVDPRTEIHILMLLATLAAMFDGFQNVSLYPYQISGVPKEKLGYVAAIINFGHRMGSFVVKFSALYTAHFYGWKEAYISSAVFILICMAYISLIDEPGDISEKENRYMQKIFRAHEENNIYFKLTIRKLAAQLKRLANHKFGTSIFAVLVLFKASDFFLQKMSRAFLIELGFTKFEIVNVVQVFGSSSVFVGGVLCGYLLKRFGVINVMFFAILIHMISLFSYLFLYYHGHDIEVLQLVIFLEGVSGGAVTTAFIAFLYELCKNGSQYAIMWAIHEVSGFVFRFFSGLTVDKVGWLPFLTVTPLLSLPVLFVLHKISLKKPRTSESK